MSNGSKIILYPQPNIYGNRFRCSKRTAAHLDRTKARLKVKGCTLRIIQGSYNTGVKISKGTHDYDAVLDVQIVGMTWIEAQHFLRAEGWAAFIRSPPLFTYHIHMISLGYTTKVGSLVPGQVASYYNHTSGLIGEVHDPTWHPDPIRATIFHYDEYMKSLALRDKIDNLTNRIQDLDATRDALRRQLEKLRN